jgi:hypothetical protein
MANISVITDNNFEIKHLESFIPMALLSLIFTVDGFRPSSINNRPWKRLDNIKTVNSHFKLL